MRRWIARVLVAALLLVAAMAAISLANPSVAGWSGGAPASSHNLADAYRPHEYALAPASDPSRAQSRVSALLRISPALAIVVCSLLSLSIRVRFARRAFFFHRKREAARFLVCHPHHAPPIFA